MNPLRPTPSEPKMAKTLFQRDMERALRGDEIDVIEERRAEIQALKDRLAYTNNSFGAEAIMQDINRLTNELRQIEEQF